MTERIALYGEQAEASAQLARVFQTAGCQLEPAYVPEAGQSLISDATRREALPSDRLILPLQPRGVNPAWFMDGTGPGFLAPGDAPADANYPYKIFPPVQACDAARSALFSFQRFDG